MPQLHGPGGTSKSPESPVQFWEELEVVASSPAVSSAKAQKWAGKLAPLLFEGEVIHAVANSRTWNTITGIVFTNARVFAFFITEPMQQKNVIQHWSTNDQIRGVSFGPGRFWTKRMYINGTEGRVEFGSVPRKDVTFIEQQVARIVYTGPEPTLAEEIELFQIEKEIERLEQEEFLEDKTKVQVVGDPMKESNWRMVHHFSRDGELPWLILNNGKFGSIAAFGNRMVIFRNGAISSLASGSLSIGGGTAFYYNEITTIQHVGKELDGALEVVTRRHPSLTDSLEPKQKLDEERFKRENCLPIPRFQYALWSPHIGKILQKVHATNR